MQYANETFFFVTFILFGGLFISCAPFWKKTGISNFHLYGLLSLAFTAIAFGFFAAAPFVNKAFLIFANTFFFAGYLYLGICTFYLNNPKKKFLTYIPPIFIVVFALIYEYLRQTGSYYDRVIFVVFLSTVCICWVFYELIKARRNIVSTQLNFFIVTAFVEIVFGFIRVGLALNDGMPGVVTLYQEPLFSSVIRWVWIVCNILSYIALFGFWTENLAIESIGNREDNIRVNNLLVERDALIASLLKANKSSSTEALSASIAHELNQPLGASLLNIQFMKMLNVSTKLTPELTTQLIDQLEIDIKRSGGIVRSLQSIFAKNTTDYEQTSVKEVVESALAISKSDLIAKNISIKYEVPDTLNILSHKGQFLQVLLNLINNSAQALSNQNSSSKIIQILCGLKDDRCVIDIIDNGPGISDDRKQNLFQLLKTNKEHGMGLGLWLCAQIIENFGGSIFYTDEEGGGARFTLSLLVSPTAS